MDTADIQVRLSRALLPFKKEPRFAELALAAPDAYGPFWLSTTLVFCLASCSNVASFMDYAGDAGDWSYDFSRLASALTLVEVFLVGLPLIVWGTGKYFNIPVSLLFLVCLYGYSMLMFIPAAVRVVPTSWSCRAAVSNSSDDSTRPLGRWRAWCRWTPLTGSRS